MAVARRRNYRWTDEHRDFVIRTYNTKGSSLGELASAFVKNFYQGGAGASPTRKTLKSWIDEHKMNIRNVQLKSSHPKINNEINDNLEGFDNHENLIVLETDHLLNIYNHTTSKNEEGMSKILLKLLLSNLTLDRRKCDLSHDNGEMEILWRRVSDEFTKMGVEHKQHELVTKWCKMLDTTRRKLILFRRYPNNSKYKLSDLEWEIFFYFSHIVESQINPKLEILVISQEELAKNEIPKKNKNNQQINENKKQPIANPKKQRKKKTIQKNTKEPGGKQKSPKAAKTPVKTPPINRTLRSSTVQISESTKNNESIDETVSPVVSELVDLQNKDRDDVSIQENNINPVENENVNSTKIDMDQEDITKKQNSSIEDEILIIDDDDDEDDITSKWNEISSLLCRESLKSSASSKSSSVISLPPNDKIEAGASSSEDDDEDLPLADMLKRIDTEKLKINRKKSKAIINQMKVLKNKNVPSEHWMNWWRKKSAVDPEIKKLGPTNNPPKKKKQKLIDIDSREDASNGSEGSNTQNSTSPGPELTTEEVETAVEYLKELINETDNDVCNSITLFN